MKRQDRVNPDVPEPELVDAARVGDRAAFEQLVDRNVRVLWRITWRILRDVRDAEDIVRESILAAHRTLPAFQGDLPFGLWMHRIAIGRALKLVERASDLRRPGAPGGPVPEPAALGALEAADLAHRLSSCRAKIAAPLRAVLALRDAEGLPWEQVEQVLALPPAAARLRLWRARLALWRCVAGHPESAAREEDELLSGYLDGDLPPTERAAVERKLETNPRLRALGEELKQLKEMAARDQEPPLPPALLDRVRAELPAEDPAYRRSATRPKAAAATPTPRTPRMLREPRPLPVGAIVIALVLVGAAVGTGFFLLETRPGQDFWQKIRGTGVNTGGAAAPADGSGAGAPSAASPGETGAVPAPAPPGTAGGGTAGAETGAARANPAADANAAPGTLAGSAAGSGSTDWPAVVPGGEPAPATGSAAQGTAPGPGTVPPAATPPAGSPASPAPGSPGAGSAPGGGPDAARGAAPSPGSTPAAPGAGVGDVQAAAPPVQAAPTEAAPATGTCARTWVLGGAQHWSGPVPENPARALGLLALRFGGKGILEPGNPSTVRITVPRGRYPDLSGALRAQGVALGGGVPPGDFDCAAVTVDAPARHP